MAWTLTHETNSPVYTFRSDASLADLDVTAAIYAAGGKHAGGIEALALDVTAPAGSVIRIRDGSASGGDIFPGVSFALDQTLARQLYGLAYKPFLVASEQICATPASLIITFFVRPRVTA